MSPIVVIGDEPVPVGEPTRALPVGTPLATSPTTSERRAPRSHRVPGTVALVCAVLIAGAVAAGAWVTMHDPVGDETPARVAADPACDRPGTRAAGSADVTRADVDGDGCDDRIAWSPDDAIAVVQRDGSEQRFSLGAPGDVLVPGDWDCDGTDTPAVYRPADGSVHIFDRWATGDDPVGPTASLDAGVHDGSVRVVRDGEGCDRVEVMRP